MGGEQFPRCLPRGAWNQNGSGEEQAINLYRAGGLQGASVTGILRGVHRRYEDQAFQRVFCATTGVLRQERPVVAGTLERCGRVAMIARVMTATIVAGWRGLLDGAEECKKMAGQAATQGRAKCRR